MPTPAEVSFRLFISAASCADQSGHEVAAYEFHVEALTLYEEALLDSKAQAAAIPLLIGALAGSRVLQGSNYGTLVAKCVACCSRLLKKSDQSRALMMAAHLFWGADRVEATGTGQGWRDGKRILECLQRGLKVADSVLDPAVHFQLFVVMLERYVWMMENSVDSVSL
ncbi:vacuolar protein sorting-associated protein 35 [Chytriomyces sp. MP71]|nr:vacuolar protein sorting-associated protein 35 [Chytriomyces sp. MP71]